MLLIVTLLPTGVLSLKKAENLQSATAYAREVMETSRRGFARTAGLERFEATINATQMQVSREIRPVPETGGRLHDVLVTIRWPGQPAPVRLVTRMPDADSDSAAQASQRF